jgi:hypothetical protein
MDDSACNFCIDTKFNPNYDITWSFKYSITGDEFSTGGFSTFLFNNSELHGGGSYKGLGYESYQSELGVTGAVLGILFYSDNTISIKTGTDFQTLYTFPIFAALYPLLKTEHKFNTIRFNLTNLGQTLNIAIKDIYSNDYITIMSALVNLNITDNDFYRVGFSYASPLNSGDHKIEFKIKDIHVQGNKNFPNIFYRPKPYSIESYYLLQSPQSGKIAIGNPAPLSSGYLLHK